jgi:putative transposase
MPIPYDELIPSLKKLLPARALGMLGRSVAFIIRLREVKAGLFVWAVVLSRFGHGHPGFEEARRWYRQLAGKGLAPRPFQLRFKSNTAVHLFEKVFARATAQWQHGSAKDRAFHPLSKRFSDVVLWDSTIMQLADELKGVFPGLRGIAAGLKVSLAVSLYGLVPLFAQIVAATRNDMLLFPPLNAFVRGTLLLFDRGFVAYHRLRDIVAAGHFYVCRLRGNGNALIVSARRAPAYVRRALRRNPDGVWLRDVLPANKRIGKLWDVDVQLRPNKERRRRVPARLVVLPGPEGEQRAYLTNLSSGWRCAAVAELYRLRWQIELVFKELKQHLNLESLPTRDPNAVQVFAWASLVALALSRTVATVFHPVQQLLGINSPLRPMLLTRALRACIRLLGRILVAPPSEIPILLRFLADQLLLEASTVRGQREDSVARLSKLIPKSACP